MAAGLYSEGLAKLMNRWPGKDRLGIYRFLPVFVLAGAAIEFAMINWRVGETNFCTLSFSADLEIYSF